MGLEVLALIAVLVLLAASAVFAIRHKKSNTLEARAITKLPEAATPNLDKKKLQTDDPTGQAREVPLVKLVEDSDSPSEVPAAVIPQTLAVPIPEESSEIVASIDPDQGEFNEEVPLASVGDALGNTKRSFWGRIQNLFGSGVAPDLESIEEILYTSDLGPRTVEFLMTKLGSDLDKEQLADPEQVRVKIKSEIAAMLAEVQGEDEEQLAGLEYELLDDNDEVVKPVVWMVVGVNGSGKTTSIGKLANVLSANGKKVILAAGDTFRAAADAQLKTWSQRAGVELFSPENVKDPSAVAFDACKSAVAKGFDHVIVDTAGRLHTQTNLMEELKKMKRVTEKAIPGAPHEVLLVVDGNNGQNALIQAKEFHAAVDLTGVILTKMDGSAKGGVVVGVAHELGLPIKRIGIGEKIEDLRVFKTEEFVDAII